MLIAVPPEARQRLAARMDHDWSPCLLLEPPWPRHATTRTGSCKPHLYDTQLVVLPRFAASIRTCCMQVGTYPRIPGWGLRFSLCSGVFLSEKCHLPYPSLDRGKRPARGCVHSLIRGSSQDCQKPPQTNRSPRKRKRRTHRQGLLCRVGQTETTDSTAHPATIHTHTTQ